MTPDFERLKHALVDRYALVSSIGRGGMATVYLAEDLKHHRQVAIKVVHPQLAATIGRERFRREIEIAANLVHPHIVPLHDSGEADGFLYYVMPFIEGETLRERLERDGPLPIEEAIQVADEIADGLAYAHGHGVIHRDIKPANVLLADGHALLVDFGIAQAVTVAAGKRLTVTGLAVGTPEYMSPDQGLAVVDIDGRSDLYSLGCVLYEMLVGHPPFEASTAVALMTRHLTEVPAPIRDTREDAPKALEAVVQRMLAKVPDERYETADRLREDLRAVRQGAPVTARLSTTPARRRRLAVGAVVAGIVAVGIWAILSDSRPGGQSANTASDIVAVLPFRVAAADPGLDYLGEGMVDLLSARLTGDGGARAVDPRTLLSLWNRAGGTVTGDLPEEFALTVARDLGAGRLISGSVVGTPAVLVLTAFSQTVPEGRILAHSRAEGPADSLTHLVDQLVAQLLALEAGESQQRLAALTSTSLPALRAYLDGQAAHRRGRYEDAVASFQEALAIDSTFALAGIGLRNAASWTAYAQVAAPVGLALAWASRDRLSRRDRTFLTALVGPRYPEPSPVAAQLAAWERAVRELPDRAEAWYELGEVLLHFGALINVNAQLERAEAAYNRSLALDSTFNPPLEHLYDIASLRHDTAQIRRLGQQFLARGAAGHPEVIRWQMALALGDRAAHQASRQELESASTDILPLVVFYSQIAFAWAGGLDDADVAVLQLRRRLTTEAERWNMLLSQHSLALNRGRPKEALRITEELGRIRPTDRAHLRIRILDALYWDGNSAAAAAAARDLAGYVSQAEAGATGAGADETAELEDLCVLEQWRLRHGDTASAPRSISRLEEDVPADRVGQTRAFLCAVQLRALLTHATDQAEGLRWTDSLDALLRVGPIVEGAVIANLNLVRLRKEQGNLEGALAASRRHPLAFGGEQYLSSLRREEGRLAAALGDTATAIQALLHYMSLRSDPEPALGAETERVAEELSDLSGFESNL